VTERAAALLVVAVALLPGCSGEEFVADAAIECEWCEGWNRPLEPFRVYGNTYYVGTHGLGSILIDTGSGLILLDGALPQSATQIEANIRELGFDARQIRFIGLSHSHFDHAGGVAALARWSGATVLAGAHAIRVLEAGRLFADDPQFKLGHPAFPAVAGALAVDADTVLSLGEVRLRAVPTPGHTPGGTSWTWQSCEDGRCLDIVYADSMTPVGPPEYRYSDGAGDSLRASAAAIAALDCDILLSTHDFSFGLHEKLEQGRDAFIDPDACWRYAEDAVGRLERRLESEAPQAP